MVSTVRRVRNRSCSRCCTDTFDHIPNHDPERYRSCSVTLPGCTADDITGKWRRLRCEKLSR
jgi:hypothetical protein